MSRIVAGTAGGRHLAPVPGAGTRPTTDRVREALFSTIAAWLGTSDAPVAEHLSGTSFLDLYAGSGAVGLEAASRGSRHVVLVESAAPVARVIRANISTTGLAAEVVQQKAETYLAQATPPPAGFDIVWLDPPYAVAPEAVDAVLAALWGGGWLAGDALVCVERSTRSQPPVFPDDADAWSRRYGETTIHFAQAASRPQEDNR